MSTGRVIALALAGLVLAAAVGLLANAITRDAIGLAPASVDSEAPLAPPAAGDVRGGQTTTQTAPRSAPKTSTTRTTPTTPEVRTTPPATAAPTTTDRGDDSSGRGSGGSGSGSSDNSGRGRGGGDD